MVISSRVAVQATLCLYHDPPTECNGNYTKAKFGKGGVVSVIRVGMNGDLVFCAIWVVNGVVWSRRYCVIDELVGFQWCCKVELYGPKWYGLNSFGIFLY